jgi:short-subunit dehydrogenase
MRDGKSCIIIGAGSGVSEAVARRFGENGYSVGLISRNLENLEPIAERLSALGITTFCASADAGDGPALEAAIGELIGQQGGCDVLVYNAAVLRPGLPLETTSEQILADFQVNLLGAHAAARVVAPRMIEKGAGSILFTGGGLSLEPFPEWTSLAVGKAALRSLALSLYKDLAPKGVHVCVLAICGIVAADGAFDPEAIAEEYWRVATDPKGVADREIIFQPPDTDPFYNDPDRRHAKTSVLPVHAQLNSE